ncbi:peptidase inhibitor family I36 protein [Streptomyces sp. NPDC002643]
MRQLSTADSQAVLDNDASSMVNESSYSIYLYDKRNCSGAHGYRARPKSEESDFTDNGWDNKTSSVKS